jgi:tRNA (cmo5U34)-methyltransferase
MQTHATPPSWSESDSQTFIDYGRYFVPERERQIEAICRLIPPFESLFNVLELCCGEGLLAEAILQRFPNCTLYGYDGSSEMLRQSQQRLTQYANRFRTQQFDLVSNTWRRFDWPVHAVVSSLAIHHLDDVEKQQLYRDLARIIAPGGALVIADIIQPVDQRGVDLAAFEWDEAVKERAMASDGNLSAFNFFAQQHWNTYRYPDPVDKPSRLPDQLKWLEQAGFVDVDVYWMRAGHAIYGGFVSS